MGVAALEGEITYFNTQPPEGGWVLPRPSAPDVTNFNTQPPEGGWD